jgi:hypothetical protein
MDYITIDIINLWYNSYYFRVVDFAFDIGMEFLRVIVK